MDKSLFPSVGTEGRLVDRVSREIQKLIVEGKLLPGARLPAERELAQQFGVSRTVMREAVHILVARGLLESRRGVGTLVRQVTRAQVAAPLSLLLQVQGRAISIDHLHQVRAILEVAIAELAAAQASEQDIAALRHILVQMEHAQDEPALFNARDADFHQALAHATGNPLLPALLDSIRDLMQEVRQLVAAQPDLSRVVLPDHRRIVERVAAHDPRGAHRAMSEHLERARGIQQAALQRRSGHTG